jgi:hypothetical protein
MVWMKPREQLPVLELADQIKRGATSAEEFLRLALFVREGRLIHESP